MTADIRNCRIQFIDPETSTVIGQWGKEGICKHDPPRSFAYPNGSTRLDNGDILVTEITDAWITRITRDGKVVWSVRAPGIRYPSDAFPTRDGQIIVADFSKPGRIVIFDPKTRKITWEYFVREGEPMLDHPSLALELPNGNVIATTTRDIASSSSTASPRQSSGSMASLIRRATRPVSCSFRTGWTSTCSATGRGGSPGPESELARGSALSAGLQRNLTRPSGDCLARRLRCGCYSLENHERLVVTVQRRPLRPSKRMLDHHKPDLFDRTGWRQTFGANLGTVHDRATTE